MRKDINSCAQWIEPQYFEATPNSHNRFMRQYSHNLNMGDGIELIQLSKASIEGS